MIAFYAIVQLDGASPGPQILHQMGASLAAIPHESQRQWVGRGAALGALVSSTTTEEALTEQPLVDEPSGLSALLAGRLDNRSELAAQLGVDERLRSDVHLVLRAFERWGAAAFEHLMGDFAATVWDGHRRQLWCARDPSGACPVYFRVAGHRVLLSSDIVALLAPEETVEPDEVAIAARLAGHVVDNERTLYRNIRRLPPAHRMRVDDHGVTINRFFDHDFGARLRLKDDREYAEHFRGHLQDAVQDQSRAQSPLAVDLSGGLDSSSICAMAGELQRAGRLQAPSWEPYSLRFPGMGCDESRYIDAVLGHLEVVGRGHEPRPLSDTAERARRYQDMPDYPNGAMADGLYALARTNGCQVVLSGCGGDEWLTGSYASAADLLASGAVGPLIRGAAAATGWRPWAMARHMVGHALKPWLPPAVRQALSSAPTFAPWIDRRLARRVDLAARLARPRRKLPGATHAQTATVRSVESGWVFHGLEMEARAASYHGLELRYPFTDRRLVAFCLAIPEDQRARSGITKWVLRGAMKGLLPEIVRMRRDKAEFSEVVEQALTTLPALPTSRWQLSRRGWIDPNRLAEALARARNCPKSAHLHALWSTFALEMWVNELDVVCN